jgi:hypothetical protein
MAFRSISSSLPKKLIQELHECEGVVVRDQCEVLIIELVDSPQGDEVFKQFLMAGNDVDPILTPAFGHPLAPYVPPNVQIEVWNILSSYQPLRAQDLTVDGPPIAYIPAIFPVLGGIQYHHTQIAIQAVQQEIENPIQFLAVVPGLSVVPSGQVICDLSIQYANAQVIRRIRKL